VSNQKTNTPEAESSAASLDEQGVADYLRRHPTFFEDKPTLLADLRIPHTTGSAVSLVERQVAALRDGNAKLKQQLEGLIQVAHENDRLNALLHKLTLKLLDCRALDALLALIDKQLRRDFSADLLAIRLLGEPTDRALLSHPEFPADADAFRGHFQRLLSAGKPYCGRLKSDQLEVLFGEQAEGIASSALLPLGKGGELGLLVIGSTERDRYHTSIDTAFLTRMAEVIATAMGQFLQSGH